MMSFDPVLRLGYVAALAVALVLLSSCGSAPQGRILVFAAASLTDVLQAQAELFEKERGVRADINFGPSNSLAQQIARGAPADVFISAGVQPVRELERKGLTASGATRELLTNDLVLVAPRGAGPVRALDDLRKPGVRLAIADPDLAPAGLYAKQALVSLGLWPAVQARLILGHDVRTTLAYVESGSADAAVVYRTDVQTGRGVQVIAAFPDDSHDLIVYSAVVVRASSNSASAAAFLDFLQGTSAREVFQRYGFTPAPRK